jgi:hypothetical protein
LQRHLLLFLRNCGFDYKGKSKLVHVEMTREGELSIMLSFEQAWLGPAIRQFLKYGSAASERDDLHFSSVEPQLARDNRIFTALPANIKFYCIKILKVDEYGLPKAIGTDIQLLLYCGSDPGSPLYTFQRKFGSPRVTELWIDGTEVYAATEVLKPFYSETPFHPVVDRLIGYIRPGHGFVCGGTS